MSDFKVTAAHRRRLLEGDYSPLDFDRKPWVDSADRGLEPGDRYVLRWTGGQPEWEPGHGIRALRVPLTYLTVTQVQRHRKGFWRVRFDVTDNRDPDVFLRRGGGYTGWDELGAGRVPDRQWLETRAKTIGEFDHQRRLARHAEEMRERARFKRERKRAA